jgi:upstream activation factor subunit UAF30
MPATQTPSKTSKKSSTPPTSVQKTESPQDLPVPLTSTPIVSETQVVDNNDSNTTGDLNDSFKSICSSLSTLVGELKTLTTEVKKLEKRVTKELKDAKKYKKVKKSSLNNDKPKRAPSGFAKPSNISEELCEFLGRPLGTMMARTEVTKHITQYIRVNDLQNPSNKRHILPDKKLATLLNSDKNDEVTYFNLQKYMKHHFPKIILTETTVS